MKCPTCPNVTLEKTERLGFYFESRPSCNGMWFERVELNKVLDKLATDQTIDTIYSTEDKNSTHSHHDSAITQQIYENREMHNEHEHPHNRHWMHRLLK